MGEKRVVEESGSPATVASLIRDLKALGVEEGATLLTHSSLSSIGWVCGGPAAAILALEGALTEGGTLVMPTHSADCADPEHWEDPPVPETWWETIRAEMPYFRTDLTPTRGMGAIPEAFRKQDGVMRSNHPIASFAAWGKDRDYMLQDSKLDYCQDEESPLGRVYEKDGRILLLGVGYDRCTSLHLAEYKAKYEGKIEVSDGVPVRVDGRREWRSVRDILYRAEDFPRIGADFEETGRVAVGRVGRATARLMRQRDLVDFAVAWMEKNRTASG
jgi:aminoglycoside 3-N-acetyltransferase